MTKPQLQAELEAMRDSLKERLAPLRNQLMEPNANLRKLGSEIKHLCNALASVQSQLRHGEKHRSAKQYMREKRLKKEEAAAAAAAAEKAIPQPVQLPAGFEHLLTEPEAHVDGGEPPKDSRATRDMDAELALRRNGQAVRERA